MQWNVGYIVSKRASLIPDKVALVYEDTPHETTKEKESVKLNFLFSCFRVFVRSCFRDKDLSCLVPACPG